MSEHGLVHVPDSSNEIFLVQLHDRELVNHARKLLDGTKTSDARIAGTVIKTPTDYNIGWSYHLAPKSIFFFELSAEVGDSTMRFIDDHLAEVGGRSCCLAACGRPGHRGL